MGVLLTVLMGGLRFGARAQATGSARVERLSEIGVLDNLLRAQIAGIEPALAPDDPAHRRIRFAGGPDSLAYVAPMPAQLGLGGLHLARLARGGDGKLTLAWRLARQETEAPERVSTLVDGVAGLSFAYFGSLDAADPPAWHDEWDGMSRLPLLVRIRVVFTDGSQMPDIVIGLRRA
jgi:general secretion pathway protein J